MILDPLYLLLVAPAFLLTLFAQARITSTYRRWSKVRNARNMTGAEAAQFVMEAEGLTDFRIEPTSGMLSDHYDPRTRTLRLSRDNFHSASLAAMAVSAHEAGHAIQHAQKYPMMAVRSALVHIAPLGNVGMLLIILGFAMQALALAKAGTFLFGAIVLFQLVTLPVEFNASRRAMATLKRTGMLDPREIPAARSLLFAAALTYVAAAASAVMQLVYFALRSGMLGGRRSESA